MITENQISVYLHQFHTGQNNMAKIITYLIEKKINTENLVSIHLPVQYWIGLYSKNNNISYRNTMVIENLIFIFTSSVLKRVIWKK
jgi:hypothetical protein